MPAKRKRRCSVDGCKEQTWIEVGRINQATLTSYCQDHYKEHTGLETMTPPPSRELRI
jgi:hypothetical protein